MQKALYKLMDKFIDGSDIYYHKDSLWIVFTETKEWVIELTDKNTLWYNYRFFSRIFDFVSLDVVENQHYITKWVEDTIQNGVRNTLMNEMLITDDVEDTIQNGVKNTLPEKTTCSPHLLEDIVQNGVKRTCNTSIDMESIEHTIKNGIKNTEPGGYLGPITIRGKVFHQFESSNQTDNVGNVIQNGVKETKAMDESVFQGEKY